MRILKITHTLQSGGHCTLTRGDAIPGWHQGRFVGQVNDVPDDVSDAQVLRLYNQTTFWPWQTICNFGDLGDGRIILNRRKLPPTMTVKEVARHLGVTPDRVRKMIAADQLPAQKRGRDWVVSALDLPLVEDRTPGRPVKSI